ncbi:MAG TPA: hypothetical protein VIG29_01430 [Vicinamibacteria bacterium]|jgi:hypothetical protein
MNLFKMALGGGVAGLVGAAIWAAIGYFTGLEIGWIAWGIGMLVGIGVRLVGSEEIATFDKVKRKMVRSRVGAEGPVAGSVAAVLAVISVLAGKYAVVHLFLSAPASSPEDFLDDAAMISSIADQIVVEHESAGRLISWPAGVAADEAFEKADYPTEIWNEAESRWNALPAEERQNLKKAQAELLGEVFESLDGVQGTMFAASFGAFDLLWFGLAAVTAFRLGASASA